MRESLSQRLLNCIDDNVLINQLVLPREVGHDVYTMAKAHSFANLSANEYCRESFPLLIHTILSVGTEFAWIFALSSIVYSRTLPPPAPTNPPTSTLQILFLQ